MEKKETNQSQRIKWSKKNYLEFLFLLSPILLTIIIVGISFPEWVTLGDPYKMVLFAFFVPAVTSIANFVVYFFVIKKRTNRSRKVFLAFFLPLSIGSILYQLYVIFSFEWIWIRGADSVVYTILINALISIVINSILIGYFSRKKVFQFPLDGLKNE